MIKINRLIAVSSEQQTIDDEYKLEILTKLFNNFNTSSELEKALKNNEINVEEFL